VAIEVPAQRLEIGDVVVLHLPGEDATVEAKLVRDVANADDRPRKGTRGRR
jgi:hypothetical protein